MWLYKTSHVSITFFTLFCIHSALFNFAYCYIFSSLLKLPYSFSVLFSHMCASASPKQKHAYIHVKKQTYHSSEARRNQSTVDGDETAADERLWIEHKVKLQNTHSLLCGIYPPPLCPHLNELLFGVKLWHEHILPITHSGQRDAQLLWGQGVCVRGQVAIQARP